MVAPFLAISTGAVVGIAALVLFFLALLWLLRPREKCPKDKATMQLVTPKSGHHKVYVCPKCHHRKKTRIPIARR
jgi:hypothetical protein